MNNKIFIFTLIALTALTVFLAVAITSLKQTQKSPTSEILENCNIISYSGEHAVNLVFFSPKSDAEKYLDLLYKTTPFGKSNFNVFYIQEYKPQCEIYEGIATLCYSKELIKKAASCPNDYIIVLDEKSSKIRSSSYMNVLSLNSAHPETVLIHEFGHAFANLADEYVPSKLPKDSKNCVDNCEKFGEINDGCFQGCSLAEYFRSIDSGVMRTLSSEKYGLFNENTIKNRLTDFSSQITGKAIQDAAECSNQNYYLIEAVYSAEENSIQIINKTIERGCAGTNGFGSSKYKLIGAQQSILAEQNFNPEFIFTDAPDNEEINGKIFSSAKPFILKIPIIPSAEKLQINYNEQTAEINLNEIGAQPCKK